MADLKGAGRLLVAATACACPARAGPARGGAQARQRRGRRRQLEPLGSRVGRLGPGELPARDGCDLGRLRTDPGREPRRRPLRQRLRLAPVRLPRLEGERRPVRRPGEHAHRLRLLPRHEEAEAGRQELPVARRRHESRRPRSPHARAAEAISGGFSVPQPVVGGARPSSPSAEIFGKHQWVVTVCAAASSAASNGQVTAYAYCVKGKRPKQKTRTSRDSRRSPRRHRSRLDTSTCPKETRAGLGRAARALHAGRPQPGRPRGHRFAEDRQRLARRGAALRRSRRHPGLAELDRLLPLSLVSSSTASRTFFATAAIRFSPLYLVRGQKKPRSPSLGLRGTTWTWRWGTLWLTTLLSATNEPGLSIAAGRPARAAGVRKKSGRRARRGGRRGSRSARAVTNSEWPGNSGRLSRNAIVCPSSKTTCERLGARDDRAERAVGVGFAIRRHKLRPPRLSRGRKRPLRSQRACCA